MRMNILLSLKNETPLAQIKDWKMKKSLEENKIALGVAFGVVFGIILGAAVDNVGLGIALGIALGAGVGSTLKNKSK
jgi:uncharacterized membrane protein